jgi:hypothetical protein
MYLHCTVDKAVPAASQSFKRIKRGASQKTFKHVEYVVNKINEVKTCATLPIHLFMVILDPGHIQSYGRDWWLNRRTLWYRQYISLLLFSYIVMIHEW